MNRRNTYKVLSLCLALIGFGYYWFNTTQVREPLSEKEREAHGFFEMHQEFRTAEDQSKPAYLPNYRFDELDKALTRNKRLGLKTTELPWIERGPGNVSGRTRGLVIDVTDPTQQTWFVGTVGGGIWKTSDAGATWVSKTDNLPNLSTSTLVQSPSNPDVFYAGTGEGFFNVDSIQGDGIFKSTDHGESWTQLVATTANADFNFVNRLIVHPEDENTLLVATNTGIFKTSDAGDTFTKVHNATSRVQQILSNPIRPQTIYATINNQGILKSTDFGDTWSTLSTGFTSPGRIEFAISPSDTSYIYAAMQGTDNDSELHVSTDAGTTWQPITLSNDLDWLSSQGWYGNTLTVHPTKPDELYVGGIDIYLVRVNEDFTATALQRSDWVAAITASNYVHADQHTLIILPDATETSFSIMNTNDGGIAISHDKGSEWQQIVGFESTQFYGADKMPGASAYIGGMQDNGTFHSPIDATANTDWIDDLGGDGFEALWNFNDAQLLLGGSQRNGLARSTDGGNNWVSATSGLTDVGSDTDGNLGPFITRMDASQLAPDVVFVVGRSGVWKSTNFGESWNSRPLDRTAWSFSSSGSQARVSKANPSIVWAGSRMTSNGRIFVSTDQGETFNTVNNYSGATLGTITSIATHPHQDSTALITFAIGNRPHLIRTKDLGETWEDLSGFGSNSTSDNGFPDVAVYCALVMPHQPETIWVGTEIGIFESTDDGVSWHYADTGFPAASVWSMKVVEDEIVIATHGRGIWSVKMPELLEGQHLPPYLLDFNQDLGQPFTLELRLRSAYDSTLIFMNGEQISKFETTTIGETRTIEHAPSNATNASFEVESYQNGKARTLSFTKSVGGILLAQTGYDSDFESPNNDFSSTLENGGSFSIRRFAIEVPGNAIHSPHPYVTGAEFDYVLNVPILLQEDVATITFDEIAIVEPGRGTFAYPQPGFSDYVVVEGSFDGQEWVAFQDGWDARAYSEWGTLYTSGSAPTPSNYKKRTINMLDKFSPGDVIFIRFRLFSDVTNPSWGWAIDNLVIQEGSPVANEPIETIPNVFRLSNNYPNPFNPSTTINYEIPQATHVTLDVYNLLGQKVATLVNKPQSSGSYSVPFDAVGLASGTYIYRIKAGDFVASKKMLLLK